MSKTYRLRYIDIAKGLSIICIIIGHLGNLDINKVVFTFHVPIFFFITGFFINQKRNFQEFVKIKFRTLIIPYILTCLIIIALGTFMGGWLNHDAITSFKTWVYASLYGAGDSYTTPFNIPSIGAIWFLWATFWASCFLRISLYFNKYTRLGFVTLLFFFGYYTKSICWFPLSIQAGACATLFMYMGYLVRISKNVISNTPKEVKSFVLVFATITWFFFIKDFQSFYLVHCDIGRGIVDIFSCVCACLVVAFISKIIDNKTIFISNSLSYFGKYSLLVLCVHITELNVFPWYIVTDKLIQFGMSDIMQLLCLIFIKITFNLILAYILSKIKFVRTSFGIKK